MVAGLAVVAAVSVSVPSVTGTDRVAGPATGAAPTLYVASINGPVSVQAISTTTNQAGKPIRTGDYNSGATESVTPDGKTLYVADFKAQAVIPISTATDKVGPHIKVGEGPSGMAITPNGRTLCVVNEWSGTRW
jgi:YVTN family beta-propeller protein